LIGRRKDMTKEQSVKNTSWKMTYEEYKKCDCSKCGKKECPYRGKHNRVPRIDGGLSLCPNL